MFVKTLRQLVKSFVEGNIFYKFLNKLHVTPNAFSLIAIVFALLGAYFILDEKFLISFPFIVLAMAWDAIDGAYARTIGATTKFGAYVEGIIDLYVEIIILLALIAWRYPFEGALVITLSMMLSYAKPRLAQVIPAKDVDWPGIGEKSQRRLFLILSLVVWYFFPTFTIKDYVFDTLSVLLYVLAVILFIGGFQRIFYAKKLIDE